MYVFNLNHSIEFSIFRRVSKKSEILPQSYAKIKRKDTQSIKSLYFIFVYLCEILAFFAVK